MEVPQSQIAFLSNIPQQGSPRNGSGPYCKKKAGAPDVSASRRPGLPGGLQHNGQVHDLQSPAHGVLHRVPGAAGRPVKGGDQQRGVTIYRSRRCMQVGV